MKKLFFPLISIFLFFTLHDAKGQTTEGQWEGTLEVMGAKLPLIFKFSKEDETWKGFMDSPSQGAKDIALSKVLVEGNLVSFEHSAANIFYEGILFGDMISGTFKQSGMSFPLDLRKTTNAEVREEIAPNRPQTPEPPFPYFSEEIQFQNKKEGHSLKGTLTIPDGQGPFPAIILVSGSGPQDRNSTIFDHEPFWVIADFLSRNGIAVLRYDERGIGESEGDFGKATSQDFKNDAQYAIQSLRSHQKIDPESVGMLGHSEGGMIAWMLAAEQELAPVDFVIALAGPVVKIPELMAKQTEDISRSTGSPKELVQRQVAINRSFYDLIIKESTIGKIRANLPNLVEEVVSGYEVPEDIKVQQKEALLATFERSLNPWFVYFMQYVPEKDIKNISIPVFAAYGGKTFR